MKRRDFIRLTALTAGALSLGRWESLTAAPLKTRQLAKSVIYICLDGGPSHLDTFDPKPKAGKDFVGNYAKPIQTNIAGIEIGQKFSNLAKIADKYSIIRGMTHGIFAHESAAYAMETGSLPGGKIVYPSMGAVVAYKTENTYKGALPPFISLTNASSRFNESGFLDTKYKSYATGGNPNSGKFLAEGIISENTSDAELISRQKLLHSLGQTSQIAESPLIDKMQLDQQKAYKLILGDERKVFDLSTETEETRDRYGRNQLGQSCLMARRLVQGGVPFITVRNGGWDTHKLHFERMDEKLPELDIALSALLEDLATNNLLDQTIVICGGEFGRTPNVLYEAPWFGGRNHFGAAFSYLVAGGGFSGGKIVGETDQRGEKVISRPVYPWDLAESIYTLLGINPTGTLPHPTEGEVPMLFLPPEKEKRGGVLTELFV